jgi:hypothetical protein
MLPGGMPFPSGIRDPARKLTHRDDERIWETVASGRASEMTVGADAVVRKKWATEKQIRKCKQTAMARSRRFRSAFRSDTIR